ncbi:MAG: HAD family hydrolase [Nostoc sp. DedQUE01]
MLKVILFDLDGTLLDRNTSIKQVISEQYTKFSLLSKLCKKNYISKFIELDCRGHARKDKVYQQLVSDLSIDKVSWQDLLNDFEANFIHYCVSFPGVQSTLDSLKVEGYTLGIITNGREKLQKLKIEKLGIEQYFEVILISEVEGIKKPDAEIFNRALKKLEVKAGESVFIGDDPVNDIFGANSVGMKTIWKRNLYWQEPIKVDAIVEDIRMLHSTIRHLKN